MSTSRLSLYNMALFHIGEGKLASLTENREPRRVLDNLYDSEVALCLEQGQWKFAIRSVEIPDDANIDPAFGFSYAFLKPSDWKRTIGLSADETFNSPLNNYADEVDYWWADVTPLYVRYISNDTSYGMDLARWSAKFIRYVELRLAASICERITANTTKADWLEKRAKLALTDARSTDAMNGPSPSLPVGSWVRARAGGSSFRDRLNLPDT